MIKLHEKYSIERDKYNWILSAYRLGSDKEGKPKIQKDTSFYANIEQVCRAILEKESAGCESIQELKALYQRGIDKLVEKINVRAT